VDNEEQLSEALSPVLSESLTPIQRQEKDRRNHYYDSTSSYRGRLILVGAYIKAYTYTEE